MSSGGSIPSSTAAGSSAPATSSFLPLMTVFPVPSSCFEELYTAFWTTADITAFRDYGAARPQCYPPSYAEFEYPTVHAGSSWYSPAVCPSGYPIASTSYNYEASATAAFCCPGAASAEVVPGNPWGGPGGRYVCISKVTTSTSLVLAEGTTVVTDFFSAYDWPISVMWAESDLKRFTPASAPLLANHAFSTSPPSSTGASRSTTSSTTAASASQSTSSTSKPSSGGLSTGAEAGIGAGIGVLVILMLALGWFLYRRRRPQNSHSQAEMVQGDQTPSTVYAYAKSEVVAPSELDSRGTWNNRRSNVPELDSRSLPAYSPGEPGKYR